MGNFIVVLVCVASLSWAWRVLCRVPHIHNWDANHYCKTCGQTAEQYIRIHRLGIRANYKRMLEGIPKGSVVYLADLDRLTSATKSLEEMRKTLDEQIIRSMMIPSHLIIAPHTNIIHTTH